MKAVIYRSENQFCSLKQARINQYKTTYPSKGIDELEQLCIWYLMFGYKVFHIPCPIIDKTKAVTLKLARIFEHPVVVCSPESLLTKW